MEACIEALYTIDGEADKRKTLEMIRVLKGAISVSKSRTGEVIYHFNRHEKKALSRMLAKYDRDTTRSRVHIDSQKRDILRKWNLVFGRQRTLTESIRGFDDMLREALATRHLFKFPKDEDKDEKATDDETSEEQQDDAQKMPQIMDPRTRRLGVRQMGAQGVESTPVVMGVLPKLTTETLPRVHHIETSEERMLRKEREAEEERKRRVERLPKFNRGQMETYLTEQKNLHEDLLTRNALMRIKTSVDKDHVFFKYRLKTKLPDSAPSLLQRIDIERSMSAMTSCTRPSTRSRLSTRHSTRAAGKMEEVANKLQNVSVTDRASEPQRPLSDAIQLERSKTVHFC